MAERTKAYCAQGYPDISSFFQKNTGPNFPTSQPGTCHHGLESELGHLDSATGSRTLLEKEEEEEGEEEEVVVMADKDWNGGTAPLRCEDEELSESEKVHIESMSLMPIVKPASAKQ